MARKSLMTGMLLPMAIAMMLCFSTIHAQDEASDVPSSTPSMMILPSFSDFPSLAVPEFASDIPSDIPTSSPHLGSDIPSDVPSDMPSDIPTLVMPPQSPTEETPESPTGSVEGSEAPIAGEIPIVTSAPVSVDPPVSSPVAAVVRTSSSATPATFLFASIFVMYFHGLF